MTDFQKSPYLFSAIVGQDKFKTAYLANIVNPAIGGLLVSGPKGSGKSTIVHSVEAILPDYKAVDGCDFNCDPDKPDRFCSLCREREKADPVRKKMKIVNLPLSCSEDRLIGSIDIERLLKHGEKKVQVGLLGQANRNILYIDEVNLLPDHLIDDILDAAAFRWNTIEREGISITHPAEFILVGTMNPEEGELRPQILDRFSLCVKVDSITDPEQRVEIVKRNLLYENDPKKFTRLFEKDEMALKRVVAKAKTLLAEVKIEENLIYAVAEACSALLVDGQRPDIVIVKTAQTVAGLDLRTEVNQDDILLAAELALCHRTRDGGLLEPASINEIKTAFDKSIKNVSQKARDIKKAKPITASSPAINKEADNFVDQKPESDDEADLPPDDLSVKKKMKP